MSLPFTRLIHADWSTGAAKRWAATAERSGTEGWIVEAPKLVGQMTDFSKEIFRTPQPPLVGFDFPIGVPEFYGRQTGLSDFRHALEQFGRGEWSRFYEVAERGEEVSLHRPFYPRVSSASAKQIHLLDGLGATHINVLRRRCELATSDRRAACSLFWTLGGNQVGKAAITGWRDLVGPALRKGAKLWPFDGSLEQLARENVPVLAETYPTEAYGHVGVRFPAGGSKQRQDDRRQAMRGLIGRCAQHGIELTSLMKVQIESGFGVSKEGEDAFDAAMGLFGMIEVVEGRRREGPQTPPAFAAWEGWIMGQDEE